MIQKIRNNAFAKNSLILFIGSMVGNVLGYLFHLIIGRMVSVEMYGEIESLISLSVIISVPALALTMVVVKYSAGAKADNNIEGSRTIWSVMSSKVFKASLPLFLISIFFIPWIGTFLKIDNYWAIFLVLFALFISLLASINNGILIGWQRFFESSISGIISVSIKLLTAVILLKIGFGVSGVMGGFLLGGIAMYGATFLAMKFLFAKNKVNQKDNKNKLEIDFVSMKKYVFPVLVGILALNVLGNVDMVLAKHHLDPILSGQYGALTVMSKAIFFATGAIATVLFSMSSEESHKKKKNSKKIFINSILLTLLVSLVAITFYFLFPRFVIAVFFGEKYFLIAQYLGWFGVMATLYSFTNLIIQYLLSINKTKFLWIFLILSIIETGSIFFFGKSIYAIIWLVSITQIIVILIGLFLILFEDKKESINSI
jgi:O-antigen/teichoic acid export membrane protein